MTPLERIAIAFAGLLGASGVAAAAASSHTSAVLLGPYSLIALTHAPAIVALALAPLPPIFNGGLIALIIGASLFCTDLALRHFAGASPAPLLAPAGGITLIAGCFWSSSVGFSGDAVDRIIFLCFLRRVHRTDDEAPTPMI